MAVCHSARCCFQNARVLNRAFRAVSGQSVLRYCTSRRRWVVRGLPESRGRSRRTGRLLRKPARRRMCLVCDARSPGVLHAAFMPVMPMSRVRRSLLPPARRRAAAVRVLQIVAHIGHDHIPAAEQGQFQAQARTARAAGACHHLVGTNSGTTTVTVWLRRSCCTASR